MSRPCQFTSSLLLARNATLTLVTQGWNFLVLVIAVPRVVSSLGAASFGLFSLAWVIIGYLALLDLGVSRAATKFISGQLIEGDGESVWQTVRTAVAANLVIGITGGMAVTLASDSLIHTVFKIPLNLQPQARLAFYAAGLAVPVLLLQGIFWAVLSAFQRFGWMNVIDGLATTAQWGGAAVLAWKGYGAGWVVLTAVAARVVSAAVCGFLVLRTVPKLRFFAADRLHGLGKLLRFGSWVTMSQLVSPLLMYLDRVLIASFVSLGAVTFYSVPFEIASRIQIIPLSLAGTLYPAFSERGTESGREQLQQLYERSMHYLFLLLVPCILYLFVLGPDLIDIWIGPAFARQTSAVVRILTLGALANALAYLPYSLLQALGRPDLTAKFHLLELPVFLACAVLLIPRWGIAGAAAVSTFRCVLDLALLGAAASRYLHSSLQRFLLSPFPRIFTLNCVLGLVLLAIKIQLAGSWARLGLGTLAVGISLFGSWYFVVNSQDKLRIGSALKLLMAQTVPGTEAQVTQVD